MDIATVTKIHTEPGDVLVVVVEQANHEECRRIADLLYQRLDKRVVVLITDKPIDVQRLTAAQLLDILNKTRLTP